MADFLQLKGVRDIDEALLSEQLRTNVLSFFQWGLLNVGNFANVTIPTSGSYGGRFHQLRLVDDPNYAAGQVWEGARQDWVFESGVGYPRRSPIPISGVYVGGAFKPLNSSGAYAHHVNFPLGRVVFDSPISTSGTVTCEYSYRLYHWETSSAPWWKQLQEDSFRVDSPEFLQRGSGAWDVLAQNRVQLPAVVVQVVPHTSRRPLEIGNGSAIVSQDVLFHVFAELESDCKFMHDVITDQWQKRLVAFDVNAASRDGRFPLDQEGSLAPSGLMYPDLLRASGAGGYAWRQLRVTNMRSLERPDMAPLFACAVRGTFEIDLP